MPARHIPQQLPLSEDLGLPLAPALAAPATSSDPGRNGQGESEAGQRLLAYLRRLDLSESQRLGLALELVQGSVTSPDGHAAWVDPGPAAMRALFARLAEQGDAGWPRTPCGRLPIQRTPMAPEPLGRVKRSRRKAPDCEAAGTAQAPACALPREYLNMPWGRVARRRRLLLVSAVFGLTAVAAWRMASVLPHRASVPLEMVLVVVFAILFAWISLGFWTALAGFFVLLRRYNRFTITREKGRDKGADKPLRPGVRTALVFPVYNEDMDRVSAGIEAVWRSLVRTGRQDDYDIHILSDTRDPDAWVAEELAWQRLRERLGRLDGTAGHGETRLYYRRRRKNIKKKSGNVADFCRRYGTRYTYMVVMDADSVMAGGTLNRMVGLMERNRHVGILQTLPVPFGQTTLLGRCQQFASRLYSPMFAAGLHYWLLGDAPYWGHNAIIRVRPFMRHCALPRLSGKPPLGGEITSHDFVESALMRRAGWGVWLAYDLPGSFEETPPNLLADLARDRRWCKGNLQHVRLLFGRGIFAAHRALFLNGVMAYGSALLWFLFLAVSTAEAIREAFTQPSYFPPTPSLFPQWPSWEPWWALSLLATTGVVLFMPKILSLLLLVIKGRRKQFGGIFRCLVSMVLEVLVSTLLAPVRMLFHSKFVFITLLGRETHWTRQQREDKPTSWSEAVRFHAGGTLLALVWAAALFLYNREFFWWISPILFSLILAIPLSVLTSRPGLGRLLRRAGLLCTPEELDPPLELRELAAILPEYQTPPKAAPLGLDPQQGFLRAVVDPAACALHLTQLSSGDGLGNDLGHGHGLGSERVRPGRAELVERALAEGPAALDAGQRLALLGDPAAMRDLHRRLWLLPGGELSARWGVHLG